MLEKLRLLFDLLDLEWNDRYADLGQWIIDHPKHRLLTAHPYGFVFDGFVRYVNGELSDEEFLALGDISSPHGLTETLGVDPEVVLEAISLSVKEYSNMSILLAKTPSMTISNDLQNQLLGV
jgi:hypothetical protein